MVVQHLLGLNSVRLKVQHQNGCEGVLGTWPPLLSHLAKSDQGFQVYIYARYALLCCMRICKFATCGLKSPFLCLYPKFQTCPFSLLVCTVLHWRNQQGGNQQIHVVKNNPTNVHVLEFGPSYDVRNGVEKAVTISCYRFDCTWIWRSQRNVGTTLGYFVWSTIAKAHKVTYGALPLLIH